jgi:hypothetical protein
MPVVQRLHSFIPTLKWMTRNRWITIGHMSLLWGIGSIADMSQQSLCNRNFEENGECAKHDNARHDLRENKPLENNQQICKMPTFSAK